MTEADPDSPCISTTGRYEEEEEEEEDSTPHLNNTNTTSSTVHFIFSFLILVAGIRWSPLEN